MKNCSYYYHLLFAQPTDSTLLQLFRYGFVAGGAFVVDYASYALTAYWLHVPYLAAAIIGFVLGTTTNYILSKYLVFTGTPKSRTGEVVLVFVISGVGLLILEAGLYLLTEWFGVHYLISKLVMTVVVFIWNFFARKFFMYSRFFNILKDSNIVD